jgi:hypothetical protein
MPGTVRGEMFTMSVEDAMVILTLDECVAQLYASAEEVAELRRAARTIVEASALDVIKRYASPTEPTLRVVRTK